MDMQTEARILLQTGNASQWKRQTLSQNKRLEKNVQANGPKKWGRVAILISNTIDFQPKVIKKR